MWEQWKWRTVYLDFSGGRLDFLAFSLSNPLCSQSVSQLFLSTRFVWYFQHSHSSVPFLPDRLRRRVWYLALSLRLHYIQRTLSQSQPLALVWSLLHLRSLLPSLVLPLSLPLSSLSFLFSSSLLSLLFCSSLPLSSLLRVESHASLVPRSGAVAPNMYTPQPQGIERFQL